MNRDKVNKSNFMGVGIAKVFRLLAVLIVAGAVMNGTAEAAWSNNPTVNNAISTAALNQLSPTITTDGSGGAIITWYDLRNGTDYDIYAQRIDANGNVQWTVDGVAICTAADAQVNPTIVSDGSGGAIITWVDERSGTNTDIYAQRINAVGVVQWTADGVVISTAAFDKYGTTIASDGSGGAIITWLDDRSGTNTDIYAQRINAGGVVQWTADGVAICTAAGNQASSAIASDGSGGAIITWADPRSGIYDIYAQRINAGGVVQWTVDGELVSTALSHQMYPTIVSDGSGGAIIAWYGFHSGPNTDIYAQRVNAAGVAQWTVDGVAISIATSDQVAPMIVSDNSGGAIITWRDYRSGNYDIYAQKINAGGVVQWTADGVAVCSAAGDQYDPTIASDGSGGAIITWEDPRSGNYDIYAQRVSAGGAVQWIVDGVAISTAANGQNNPTIASDGSGGAIITWCDFRSSTNNDIYAQKADANGILGAGQTLKPDLVVTAVSVPTTAGAGGTIAVSDTTKNNGPGAAGASTTKYYLSVNGAYDAGDVYLGSRPTPALAAGASSSGGSSATIPAGTAAGNYYIIAVADASGAVAEIYEKNNSRYTPIKIGPDLIVSKVIVSSTILSASLSLTVSDTTRNVGLGTAGASTTKYYLSKNGALDAGDVYLGSRPVPVLAAGASGSGGTSVTIPGGTASGLYYIIAVADANGAVAEIYETNNIQYTMVRIGVDLMISTLVVPYVAVRGATITINESTRNSIGTAGATTNRYYLSKDGVVGAGDVLLGGRSVPLLTAGAVSSTTANVTIPLGTTPGKYYIIAVADADGAVVEIYETNNTQFRAITIQ